MAVHRFKQVTWNVPEEIYKRFRDLHNRAQTKNFASIPASEQDFAILMIDDAVTRGENVLDALDKDGRLIIDPFEAARKRITSIR